VRAILFSVQVGGNGRAGDPNFVQIGGRVSSDPLRGLWLFRFLFRQVGMDGRSQFCSDRW
jgi:hypothetical protein